MDQQKQTQDYFDMAAREWQAKAVNAADEYSVIEGRNSAVLAVVKEIPDAQQFLDVGCGTGQLVLAVAAEGLEAEGVDYSAQMIAQCESNQAQGDNKAKFRCASFFDVEWRNECFDVISAQGFIEYISQDQMEEFFARCHRLLKPGETLVVGSRNRLFNIVPMNEFSRMELSLGLLAVLEAEGIAMLSASTQEEALSALRRFERVDLQPDRHPDTGIKVDVRYQYTPADLIARAFILKPRNPPSTGLN
jgi:2-polyprenyl-3-methyl-5-hydroxy-6-metoxy-1,4-benzoquinol methylase